MSPRRAGARRARTTKITPRTTGELPTTADGELYRIAQAYAVNGEAVAVAYVVPPVDRKPGAPWRAVLAGRSAVPVSQLVPIP